MDVPVKKLLVANRGEVAVRVMQTAAAMGVRTVAVYSEDDADCAHVARADETHALPGRGPSAYLDVARLVGIAAGRQPDLRVRLPVAEHIRGLEQVGVIAKVVAEARRARGDQHAGG